MGAPTLRARIEGCFAGIALGDALGMPWETCTHEEIFEATAGRGVRGLEALPEGHPRRVADPRGLALGSTTDDWQLSRAVAVSLLRCGGFHLFDQAAAHVEALEVSTQGWGGSTRDAVGEMKRWFDSRGREGRRPDVPAPAVPKRGKGNGVLMKLAPLVCLAALRGRRAELRGWIDALGRMSHDERVSPDVGGVLLALLEGADARTLGRGHFPRLEDRQLRETLTGLFTEGGALPSADEARLRCGTSFLASESAAFCLATLARHPDAFEPAVLEAINGGGDTDTNASIVGALVGAAVGIDAVPRAWIDAVPEAPRAVALAGEFVRAFG